MNKKLVVIIGIIFTIICAGNATARPLLDIETEYGNLYSESYSALVQQVTSADADMVRDYIKGEVIYDGTTVEDKGDEMITVYVWRNSLGERIDDTRPWGGVPQIDESEFEERADVTGDGKITEADAKAIDIYASFGSFTFPRFETEDGEATVTQKVGSIDEAISFTIMRISSNWLITGINLIITYFIVFFSMLFVAIVIIMAAKIKPKKSISMYMIIIASFVGTLAFYFIELMFMNVIVGGIVGILLATICIALIYLVISYYWFGIAKKDTAEFTISLTIITMVLWAAMNAYWMM